MGFEVVGLDHVQLAMPPGRESEAEAFYGGRLGFTRVPKPEPMAQRGGCWFTSGAAVVHLGVEADFRAAQKAHPALLVRNLAGLADSLVAQGVEVRPNPDQPAGASCYVDDPFGNRIELIDAH
ncbi:MAG TPA: VOC family protein [Acidimicrobiales bacterium]|jgi:catechol 2,3-dioxygenase-like lactoylglutathione lyase family enzyme